MLLVEPAIIEIALHRPMVSYRIAAVERNQFRLVFGGLRPRVDRAIVVGEQFDRRRSDHAEEVVCRGRDQMNFGIGALPAEIAIEARQPRWRLVAPAVVLEAFRGKIETPLPVAHAVLQGAADAAVGAARGIEFGAAVGEAVLHLEADRATKGVEAEGRVVGPDIRAADRDLRNQVPVDGVAEGLIDADTLHVDGEPLRRALQWRRREAAIA